MYTAREYTILENLVMLLYHYTVGYKLRDIFADGILHGSPRQVKLGEKRVVWLSANQHYEQTARKSISNPATGLSELLSIEDTATMCGGIYRFVFDTTHPIYKDIKFIPWPALRTAAKMRDKHVKPMLARAKGVNASPKDWHGVLNHLSIEGATLQHLSENGWNDVPAETPLPEKPDNMRFDALSITKQQVDDSTWR